HGSQAYVFQSAPHHGQPQIDGGENPRHFAAREQTPSPEPDAKWNQQQAEYKNAGKDQKDQKADIGMRRPGQEDFIEPEGDGGKRRARRDHGSREGEGILPQKIDWLQPVSDAFSQIHVKPLLSFFRVHRCGTHFTLGHGPSAALDNLPNLDGKTGQDYYFRVLM